MAQGQKATSSRVCLLVFEVDRLRCAFAASEVREILPMAALSTPPGMPELLSGLLNVGGEVIPVVAVEAIFGLAYRPCHLHSPLILLGDGEDTLALTAHRVRELAEVSANELIPLNDHNTLNDCVTAEFRMEGESVYVLSVPRLLVREERERVRSFAKEESRRLELTGESS